MKNKMNEKTSPTADTPGDEAPLESWKEIAAYLKRDTRTVRRWEKSERLPVRRHLHQARSSVYAYPSELDAWWATRQPAAEESVPLWRRPAFVLRSVAVLLLALMSVASGPILTPPGVAAQDSAGIVARKVWAGTDVDLMGAVSSDGQYLSYTDWDTGDLAVRNLRTGQKRRLTAKGSWNDSGELAGYSAFSPDGTQVAYAWGDSNSIKKDLRITGIDGGQPRVLYRNENAEVRAWGGPFDWSPDGKQLLGVFTRQDGTNQLVLISANDGSTRVLKSFDWRSLRAFFSPDGRYIVYDFPPSQTAPERDVFLIAIDGSREVRLVTHPANDMAMGWSPDGNCLLFVSDRTGTNSVWTISVSNGQAQGEPELLKPDIGRVAGWGGITKSGDFYYVINIGVQDAYVATVDPGSGNLVEGPVPLGGRFFGGKSGAVWSPDGEHVAYMSQSPGQLSAAGGTLSIYTLKTSQVRDIPLLSQLKYAFNPTWLTDGRALIVFGPDLRGRRGLHRVDLSTGRIERITPAPGHNMPEPGAQVAPALSPDGKRLFYYVGVGQGRRRSIWMQDLQTGDAQEVYPAAVATFALSPDGRWLALMPAPDPQALLVTERQARIVVVPSSGGEPRSIMTLQDPERRLLGPLAWSQDGNYVFFVQGTPQKGLVPGPATNELWRVPVEGGAPQKLGIALPAISRVSMHPNGRRLAISGGSPEFEVWVLENFLPASTAAK